MNEMEYNALLNEIPHKVHKKWISTCVITSFIPSLHCL